MIARLLAPLRLPRRKPPAASRPSRRHSARAAVWSGVAMFAALTAGMAVAIETVKPEWRDPEFGHRLRRLRQAQREGPARPLVLVVGTSRTQNAISPAAMGFPDLPGSPRVFNFGQSASPPLKELLTVRRLLGEGVRPAAVLVEVFPAMLMIDGPAEDQLPEQAPRLSRADLDRLAPYCGDPTKLRDAWRAARIAPWAAQRQILMSHWLPRWLTWQRRIDFLWESVDADGFQPVAGVSPEFRALSVAKARREYAHAFAAFRPGDASVRALGDLVALCRAEGIAVAFFVPPVSPDFRRQFAPGVFEAGERYAVRLGREFGVEVFPAPPAAGEDEFIDGHHPLRHGAERYSRWLAGEHLKPWLARQGVGK